MAEKNTAKVMINGKIVTLGGYESEEYFQRVANYINHKIEEMEHMPSYRRMTPETKANMLAINIADDYFKAKIQADYTEREIEDKDREAYEVKHDLVSTRMEIDELKKELNRYKNNDRN